MKICYFKNDYYIFCHCEEVGCDVSQEDYECSLENLSESLSHQLSFYSASYLAVPYLVKLFELKEKAGDFEEQLQLLLNIGAIFATDIDNSQ